MKYICSWSGGKDSTATIILCHEKGLPLDEIVFVECMYDKIRGISGEDPLSIKWIMETAKPTFESWGYKVNVLHGDHDFLDLFFNRLGSGKRKLKKEERRGKFTGYLISGMCWMNHSGKITPINRFLKGITEEYTQYIGIAADEPKRLKRLKPNMISLLNQYGMTEKDAYYLCAKYDLLNPVYQYSKRGGCWFCPNGSIANYARLKETNPDLYNEFIALGNTPNLLSQKFKYNITIQNWDKMVKQYIEQNKNKEKQLKLF